MNARPKPASLWVVDTRALGRRPGTLKTLALTVYPTLPVGNDVLAVPRDSAISLDLRLESVSEGVLVSGAATGVAQGECVRCLIEVTEPIAVPFRELYAYPGSTTEQTTGEDEIPRLVDELIDLEPLVTDEIVLGLPLAPVCRPDCAGLCVECGVRLDDAEPGHNHEILDPRWAALRDRLV